MADNKLISKVTLGGVVYDLKDKYAREKLLSLEGVIAGGVQIEVVNELPTASKDTVGKIYLISHTHSEKDIYDEYLTIIGGTEETPTYSWEKIGNTDIDLSSYAKKTDIPTSLPASDVSAWAKESNKPTYTASEVGALASTTTHLSGDIATSEKGSANGVATLDENGKIPSGQLPSYVDDVLEYSSKDSFPTTGEASKIYVDTTANLTYRWGGSKYVEISPSLALGETSSTAYRGDRGKIAYDHSQTAHARTDATKVEKSSTNGNIKINGTETTVYTHPSGTNPHGTTKSDVGLGNVGDFKAVSTVANQGLSNTEKSNARANIGAGTSSFSGSYNDLSNKPTIPTNNNQLTNGAGYITSSGTAKTISDTLPISKGGTGATTARAAEYNILSGMTESTEIPNDSSLITYTYVNPSETEGKLHCRKLSTLWSYIKSKLATVATSGSYNDLSNKPTIPTVGNGTITIKQAGASKGSFTMNQSGNTTIELTDNNTDTWRGIQNNLTSDSTSDSLSAAQGKVLKGEIDSLKKSVSDGKSAVASAITSMGVSTESDATFETMATNVSNISKNATAVASDILSGKTAYSGGSKITGSMTDNGAKTALLNCGGSYTIPKGYHNGSGKITANSLASQTSATAVANAIQAGKTAYVNGSKVTGTYPCKAFNAYTSMKDSNYSAAYKPFENGTLAPNTLWSVEKYSGFKNAILAGCPEYIAIVYKCKRSDSNTVYTGMTLCKAGMDTWLCPDVVDSKVVFTNGGKTLKIYTGSDSSKCLQWIQIHLYKCSVSFGW